MWKEIANTNGKYLISDDGKVFSVQKNRLLKPQLINTGYLRVELAINGQGQRFFIHRLVAETFIDNPNNYPIVNHKDENPLNNHVSNLEWCTYKYNSNYGTCQERIKLHKENVSGYEHKQSKTVYQFDIDGNLIAEFGSCGEASRITGFNSRSISKCCTGKLKQYANYGWSYSKEYKYDPHIHHNIRNGAVLKCDASGNVLKRYVTTDDLKTDGYSIISVMRVCRGERKSYHGFVFKYE